MVEIGVTGTPFRAATIAVGAAMAAEADGAHALWYPDGIPGADQDNGAAAPVGSGIGLDPTDVADPLITVSAAVLVARHVRVGILGWNPGGDAGCAARAAATLADLAPGRVILACAAADGFLTELAEILRPDLDIELSVYGQSPEAAPLGWGWIGSGLSATALAKHAGDAGVVGALGIHLAVFVHEDADVACRGATATFGRPEIGGDAVVVGTGADLERAISEYVTVGVTRVVIDNALPYALPEELESTQAVIRSAIGTARLRHRDQS